jgi:hypothetical protein
MKFRPAHRWAVLRVQARASGFWLDYEDDGGRKRRAPPDHLPAMLGWTSYRVPAAPSAPASDTLELHVPADLFSLLADAAADLPAWQAGPYGSGPVPLPIFVGVRRTVRSHRWTSIVEHLLRGAGLPDDRFEVVRLARARWRRRRPFGLPLRIGAAGAEADYALSRFRAHGWLADDSVQRFGVRIEPVEAQSSATDVTPPEPDLLLCDAGAAVGALRRVRATPLGIRPRLVVLLDSSSAAASAGPRASLQAPPGVSLLWLAAPSSGDLPAAVDELLHAIIHDYPLHEVAKTIRRHLPSGEPSTVELTSDPEGVQDLRMVDALAEIVDDAIGLESTVFPGDVIGFLGRVAAAPLSLEEPLAQAAELARPMEEAFDDASSLDAVFVQESVGLVPLAHVKARLAAAHVHEAAILDALARLEMDPELRRIFAQQQERHVDIALRRLDVGRIGGVFVRPHESLRRGTAYRLRVQIGRRLRSSLVRGTPPPLDPLLPARAEGEGHILHVVVYGLDFRVASATMRRLVLPPHGASDPVEFDVVAPERAGRAGLRVAIYYDLPAGSRAEGSEATYHNHLLQSFLFAADVEHEEGPIRGALETEAWLEFSRTARFANLADLTPRLLSLGLNDGPGGGTHTLVAKRGGETQTIHFSEGVIGKQLERVRDLLTDATWDDARRGPRFADGPRTPHREQEFDRFIRDLARAGRELYHAVWSGSRRPFQDALHDVRAATDEIVQVVRFAQNYLFPWSVLYDFPMPRTITGAAPAEVCRGFERTNADGSPYACEQCLATCLHPDKREAVCVYGFWGQRLQIEQLLHTPHQEVDAVTLLDPVREGAVKVAVGLVGGLAASLASELASELGTAWVEEIIPPADLLTELWTDDRRPAILLLVGHYETRDLPGEPSGARLTLPGGSWLQADEIIERAQEERRTWAKPHPLILLGCCEGTAADLGTLTGFLSAFADAHAGAVVGSETVVFEGLACRFGKEITAALFGGASLGEAVLRFRRDLLRQASPLGFVFTPYGDAGLARQGGAGATLRTASGGVAP